MWEEDTTELGAAAWQWCQLQEWLVCIVKSLERAAHNETREDVEIIIKKKLCSLTIVAEWGLLSALNTRLCVHMTYHHSSHDLHVVLTSEGNVYNNHVEENVKQEKVSQVLLCWDSLSHSHSVCVVGMFISMWSKPMNQTVAVRQWFSKCGVGAHGWYGAIAEGNI